MKGVAVGQKALLAKEAGILVAISVIIGYPARQQKL